MMSGKNWILDHELRPSLPQTRLDRAGFERRYGVHVFRAPRAPFISLGIHVDWHTPTLDLHIGRTRVQIGKNNWEGEGRFSYLSTPSDGHTDQCTDRFGAAAQ